MRFLNRILCVSLILLASGTLHAQYLGWDYQEQARTHNTDIDHIEMHISFVPSAKKVVGTVYHTLSVLPQKDPVTEIVFDAVNLNIARVWLEGGKSASRNLTFDTTESSKLRINFGKPVAFNTPMKIGIEYSAVPKKGMYFIAPDSFYTSRPEQIWTQGEGEDNRHWLPTYDYPNDKATTDMYVTVRADQKALSNGKLVGKQTNKDGSVTWHYNEAHPFSTYLIMIGVGNYEVPTDKWRGKNVEYWVYPGWQQEANRIFGLTPKMLEFFSNKLDYPYAWEKYSQIAIADFMYGGMENVSATTLNDYVLFDKRSGVDFNGEGLIAHELAHQWFGDVVTCRSWIHMWLNESFATYFEALFRESYDGKDEFDEEMQSNQNAALSAEATLGKKPIVAANNYTANHYPRGAAVLNMMRHVLGDEGFFHSIHHYLMTNEFKPVVTENLKLAIEETTGQNLQWYFDQWLYKAGHPIFDVTYNYDASAKLLRMTVTQTQARDTLTGTFKMPVDVELTMPDGSIRTETLRIQDSTQNFTIVAPQQPSMVIFDKGNTVLKELHITKSASDWIYQLAHAKLAIERSQAAQYLSSKEAGKSAAAFDALKNAVTSDPFWAVRVNALRSLATQSDDSHPIDQILASVITNDKRPDMRAAAVELLDGSVTASAAKPILASVIDKDSSYHVVGSALMALYALDSAAAYNQALTYLKSSSPRDRMRQSAIQIVERTKSKPALEELVRLIGERNIPRWTRYNIIGSIGSMASVDSARVYQVLWTLSNNGDYAIRGTALNKLADIGDVQTLHQIEAQSATRPDMKVTYDALLGRMRKRLNVQGS